MLANNSRCSDKIIGGIGAHASFLQRSFGLGGGRQGLLLLLGNAVEADRVTSKAGSEHVSRLVLSGLPSMNIQCTKEGR